MTAEGFNVLRLQHVSLPFPGDQASFEAARRFYGQILGMEERPRPDVFPGVGIWYAIADQELHLFSEASGVAANPESRRHPCFEVDDVVGLRAHLVAAGVTTRDQDGQIPGRSRFFAVDPFENTLEFVHLDGDHW